MHSVDVTSVASSVYCSIVSQGKSYLAGSVVKNMKSS